VHVLSIIIFSVGVVLGVVSIGMAIWGDFEAILFNPGIRQSAMLRPLRCPIMITHQETGIIRARLKNTLDRPTTFFLRTHISEGYVTLMREVVGQVPLDAGEAQWVEWPITAEDAAYGRLVLFKTAVRAGYPLPTRQATCGVLVVRVPALTGNQIYALGTALSLVCIAAGLWLWIASTPHMLDAQVQIIRAMVVVAASVVLGIVAGVLGWWVAGALFLLIILLTTGVIIGNLAGRSGQ
jgi:hypothetical protein